MNEVLDRIENVLLAAARRRASRRHRRIVIVAATAALLLLTSAASAVTGVGPLGEALTRDEVLPEGAEPAPSGESVTLAGATADGRRQEVRFYRRAENAGDAPGVRHYCAASYSASPAGKVDPISIICMSGAELAASLEPDGLWLGCSGRGGVIGEPAAADPVCGLTLADTERVEIESAAGGAAEAQLSDPLDVLFEGRVLRVRAILGVLDAPPTQPGENKPRVEVTAFRSGGEQVVSHVGGERVLLREDMPSLDPTPEERGPRVRVDSDGAWAATAWRTRTLDHCVRSTPLQGGPVPDPSIMCLWRASLGDYRRVVREGSYGMATRVHPPGEQGSYAVYGVVRADAASVVVHGPDGRAWTADLSEPWTTIHRRAGDLLPILARARHRFRDLPQSLEVRIFQAVASAPPGPGRAQGMIIETTLPDGTALRSRPLPTQASETSAFPPPPGTGP